MRDLLLKWGNLKPCQDSPTTNQIHNHWTHLFSLLNTTDRNILTIRSTWFISSGRPSTMSKITVAGVRTNVQELLKYSTEEKKRNFLETVEASCPYDSFIAETDQMNSSRLVSRIMTHSVTSVSLELSSYQLFHVPIWLSGR